MYATVSLLFVSATLCVARPYYQPQQRQLFYSAVPSVVPQYSQYSQFAQYPAYQPYTQYPQYNPVAPAPVAFKQYYYAPQSAANILAPAPSALRYPAAVAPAKQVVYYPGAAPYPFLPAGDENAETPDNGWGQWFTSNINSYIPEIFGGTPSGATETGSAPPAAPAQSPASSNKEGDKENENSEKENEEAKPAEENKTKAAPQKYVLVGQPQFYGLQPVNPAAVIPSPQNGAVSSYLLLKNYPGVRFAAAPFPQVPQIQQVPQVPQQPADAELIPAGSPGKAALSYYKLLQQAQVNRQQKEYEDTGAVTVDADPKAVQDDDKESVNQEAAAASTDDKEDDEPGPTVAQAKPKAVALAGPGGVAAAAPVGTALVGPGGMAISAPEATAVAGAKGAGTGGVVSAATTKMATKAMRTYQLASQNLGYLLNL